MKKQFLWLILTVLLVSMALLHLSTGEIALSVDDFLHFLKWQEPNSLEQQVIREFRIPRLFTCLVAGAALSVSGLLMQTAFQNPLAGPYVLGINSGAGLFVAIALLTGWPLFAHEMGIVGSAIAGSALFAAIIVVFARFLKNNLSLLLVGIMIGSFTSALVYILQSWSTASDLKRLTFWAFGSVQHVGFEQLPLILVVFLVGVVYALFLIRILNTFVIGEIQAKHLGIRTRRGMLHIIGATVILTGLTTAYCGPISFIGLAVPNLVRILFSTQNHRILLPASLLLGASFLLFCDLITQLSAPYLLLPINAITSLLGAPIVVYLILKKMA